MMKTTKKRARAAERHKREQAEWAADALAARGGSETAPITEVGMLRKEAGYWIGENGRPIAPGVICKCGKGFCPAHGKV